mmetsp:Transcript_15816/g.45564  ORF Transcript_15816/g.45564 Transcript_15816/m.45564 type:complete len:202 (-) Transcript_15816:698-1303(-)
MFNACCCINERHSTHASMSRHCVPLSCFLDYFPTERPEQKRRTTNLFQKPPSSLFQLCSFVHLSSLSSLLLFLSRWRRKPQPKTSALAPVLMPSTSPMADVDSRVERAARVPAVLVASTAAPSPPTAAALSVVPKTTGFANASPIFSAFSNKAEDGWVKLNAWTVSMIPNSQCSEKKRWRVSRNPVFSLTLKRLSLAASRP